MQQECLDVTYLDVNDYPRYEAKPYELYFLQEFSPGSAKI
jgi:hypothetical protein